MNDAIRERAARLRGWTSEKLGKGSQARVVAITVIVLVVLLGALFAWRMVRTGPPQMPPAQALPVSATVVEPQSAARTLDAVGTLTAVREVMLSPEVPGRVTAIRFDSGDWVRSGALLVQLNDAPERADRRQAAAQAEFAQIQLARSEELAPTGAEPRQLLDQRRSERAQALAAVQQNDARIRQKQVRAPFAGKLGIRRVDPGEYLNPGDAVATLTALDPLNVEFSLPQQELARLREGANVTVVSDAYPDRVFTARVNAIEPVIGSETRNVTVQARLPNPDQALRPGMYVTASLMLDPQQDALIVPATAVQTSAQGNSVIVIRGPDARKEGTAEIVPVETGRRIGDAIVIVSGLKAGDVVVGDGQLRVQPGAKVKVVRNVPAGAR